MQEQTQDLKLIREARLIPELSLFRLQRSFTRGHATQPQLNKNETKTPGTEASAGHLRENAWLGVHFNGLAFMNGRPVGFARADRDFPRLVGFRNFSLQSDVEQSVNKLG